MPDPITDLLAQATHHAASLRHPPESTYRVQFHVDFTFRDATVIIPYLADLGITHLYASPYLKANKGSTHGYDVIDHCRLNPELGTETDHAALLAALKQHGLSHILDTVPNHVGVATNDNVWWNDVLAHGRASQYATYFDIAWDAPPRPQLKDRVLLPVLGDLYATVLERGDLKLIESGTSPTGVAVAYFDRHFPLSPETAAEAQRAGLASFTGSKGDPKSWDKLDALLTRQHYRLAFWRVAPDEINYRRFFDINDLAAIRQENVNVFTETHALTMRWLAEGSLTGLRVDHPDGLYDPAQYFHRLQQEFTLACAREIYNGPDWTEVEPKLRERLNTPPTPGAERSDAPDSSPPTIKNLYVLAEKILAREEPLPQDWPIDGTSGYDFLNFINGLFIHPAAEQPLTRLYEQFTGDTTSFEDLVYEKKLLILRTSLASELHMLAHQLDVIAQSDRHSRDFTLTGLRDALAAAVAAFPVYRTYITSATVRPEDVRYTEHAIAEAIRRNPLIDPAIFHFIRDTLLQKRSTEATLRFAGKFQQLTAPDTAKGIEDTAFYIYNRFVFLNEVGGDPGHFGTSPAELHAYLADRQRRWPSALSALSTHDTKRSEDVRARLNVLSEIPDEWRHFVLRWRDANSIHKTPVDGSPAPSPNDEYLLYQTLLGAWPLLPHGPGEFDAFVNRVVAYMQKALRESKVHTSWTRPNAPYEKAVETFTRRLLDSTIAGPFLDDLRALLTRVMPAGLQNSLAQTLLRLTAPGVPDTYQGTELFDFSLVDPDNRRPVDYAARRALLATLPSTPLPPPLTPAHKLVVTRATLDARRAHPGLFSTADYLPLDTTADHRLFAFARTTNDAAAITLIPRFSLTDLTTTRDIPLPAPLQNKTFRHLFTNERVVTKDSLPPSQVLRPFPVALLMSE